MRKQKITKYGEKKLTKGEENNSREKSEVERPKYKSKKYGGDRPDTSPIHTLLNPEKLIRRIDCLLLMYVNIYV